MSTETETVEPTEEELEAKFGWAAGDVRVAPGRRESRFNPNHAADGKFAAGHGGGHGGHGGTPAAGGPGDLAEADGDEDDA